MAGNLINREKAVQGVRELFSLGDCYCDEASIVGMLNSLDGPTITGDFNARKFIAENVAEPLTKLVELAYNLGREMKPKRNRGYWSTPLSTLNAKTITLAYMYPRCSVCGKYADYTNFCPHCGADMRTDVNET